MWQSHKNNRHFAGVAVVFFAGFAFREVSRTRIVIVHFLMWKVIRISTPTLPHCHSRACFTTARQWRGCGKGALSSSATGSDNAPFPPFGGWNQPPACECSLFTVPYWGLLFYRKLCISSSFSQGFQRSVPTSVSPETALIATSRSCPRRPVPCTRTGM